MTARIYQPARSAMQSGQGKDKWMLEYEPEKPREIEPLMGWTSSSDMKSQVRLMFETKEEAISYADRAGLKYDVELPQERRVRPKAYADNFRYGRIENWTH